MPNRMIKDSIHWSDKVNAMTDFQFRLWVSLITYVDDYGRGDARPAIIKGSCFPLRERLPLRDIDTALHGLADIGCIVLYEVEGHSYLCFPNWEKHQTIRNKRSKFPAPVCDLQAIENNCKQLNANVSVIQSNPIQVETESESKRVTRFAPPTREEAEDYCRQNNITVSLDTWFAYYEQNGWIVGKSKMKDWQASLRYWQTKEKRPSSSAPGKAYSEPPEKQAEKIERMRKMTAAMKGEA